jgi:hypothetical protein
VTFLTTIHDHDVLLDATIAGEQHWAIALSLWGDDALRDVDFSVEHVAFGAGITLGITGRQLPDYKGNGAEEGIRLPDRRNSTLSPSKVRQKMSDRQGLPKGLTLFSAVFVRALKVLTPAEWELKH